MGGSDAGSRINGCNGVISKENFLNRYFNRVTICLNKWEFTCNESIILREGKVRLEQVGDYYCPWHYNAKIGNTYEGKGFEDILGDYYARVVKIKEVESKISFSSKRNQIEKYINEFKCRGKESVCPVPIATDTKLDKTLVLDSNKTLVALYQSWERDIEIPIIEICGEFMIKVFPDFCIVCRS